MSIHRKLMTGCAVAVLAFGLAACGSSSDDDTAMDDPVTMPEPTPTPTPYEMALTGIAAADTAAAAQAAYDAVKDDVTASEGEDLQDAVDSRTMALATAARAAMQMANLMTAAGAVDTSGLMAQADIDAAQAAIDALKAAIAAAADVADTSMYQSQVDTAEMAVDTAQAAFDTEGRMADQMMALSGAASDLHDALAAISGVPTQAEIDAATTALAAVNMAIADAADLDDTSSYELVAANAQGRIDGAEKALMAANAAAEEEQRLADEAAATAMRITAGRLSAGIGSAPLTATGNGQRSAAYGAQGNTATANTIVVTYDSDATATTTETMESLTEDKTAVIHDNHGWAGKRYTRTMPGEGPYEARVYSNVKAPKEGRKFGSATPGTGDNRAFEYMLNAAGALPSSLITAANVAFTGVTRTSGKETFKLPEDDQTVPQNIIIPGSYHGVSGDYSCDPVTNDNGCSATVAAKGFTISSGDAWTFKPGNANARVMDAADTEYASYGWWLHKSADGRTFTASAFNTFKGAVEDINITALEGTATYVGGAAGKYSLFSTTGGTNDAGHFTARATLEADFTNKVDNTGITGAIDQFIGADGEMRNWSVELMGSPITAAGGIGDTTIEDGTQWTIDGAAAGASGQWSGSLREVGDDDVPEVATGIFYSRYSADGRMVGAFGANKQ